MFEWSAAYKYGRSVGALEATIHILENRGLARVHVFRKRLPMMHRDEWAGRKANSGMAFAWMVWDRDYNGPTTLTRISWER